MPISPLKASSIPALETVPISDGSGDPGASLDAWVSDGSGGGSCWIPLVTGAEPIEFVSDGAGQLVMIPFSP